MAKKGNFIAVLLFILCSSVATLSAQSVRSDSLFAVGVELFRSGRFEKAATVFGEVSELDSIYFKVPSSRMQYGKIWQAASYYRMGCEDKAVATGMIYYDLEPVDRRLTVTSDRYIDMGEKAMAENNLDMAAMYYRWCADAETEELGERHYYVANSMMALARTCVLAGDYDKATDYLSKAEKIYRDVATKFNFHTAEIMQIRASVLYSTGKVDKVRPLAEGAYAILKGNMSSTAYVYNETVAMLSNIYIYGGEIDRFVALCSDVMAEYNALSESDRLMGAFIPMSLADACISAGNFKRAGEIVSTVLSMEGISGFENGADIVAALSQRKASVDLEMGDFTGALEAIQSNIDYFRNRIGLPESNLCENYLIEARALNALGRYDEALVAVETSEAGYSLLPLGSDNGQLNVVDTKAGILRNLKRNDEALALYDKLLKLMDDAKSNDFDKAYINYEKGCLLMSMGRLADAGRLTRYAVRLFESSGRPLLSVPYFNAMTSVAINFCSDNPDEAVSIFNRLKEIASGDDELSRRLASGVAMSRAEHSLYFGDTEKAFEGFDAAMALADGSLQSDYMLETIAGGKLLEGQFEQGLQIRQRLADSKRERYGETSLEYASELVNLARMQMYVLDVSAMDSSVKKVISILDSHRGNVDHMLYLGLYDIYSTFGDFANALRYAQSADSVLVANGADELMRCHTYNALSTSLLGLNRVGEATDYAMKAARVMPAEWVNNLMYPVVMKGVAECLNASGDMKGALEYYTKAIEKFPEGDRSGAMVRVAIINGMVPLLHSMGMHAEALELMQGNVGYIKDKISVDHALYGTVLINDAYALAREGRADDGSAILFSELDRLKGKSDGMTPAILNIESEIVYYLVSAGMSWKAFQLGEEYLSEIEGDSIYSTPVKLLLAVGQAAQGSGHYDKALQCLDRVYGEDYQPGVSRLDDIRLNASYAKAYEGIRDKEKSLIYYRRAFDAARDFVLNNFLSMSAEQRRLFWNDNFTFFRSDVPVSARMADYDDRFAELAYNSILFSTSLLLQSEKTIGDAVEESGDRAVRKLYEKYLSDKAVYDKAVERGQDSGAVGELRKKMEASESQLLARLKDKMGNYNEGLAVRWDDVRDSLGDNDAAVEFVEYLIDENYSIYDAAVVRKGYTLPKMQHLFICDSRNSPFDSCYVDSRLTDRLWRPLSALLAGCDKVWFSPQGRLTTVAIESLPGIDEITGKQETAFARLTSTRELATRRGRAVKGGGAVVYGGLDYKMDAESMASDAASYNVAGQRHRSVSQYFGEGADRKVAWGLSPLPGTLREAEILSQLLAEKRNGKSADVSLKTGRKGTEASFKSLDGKKKKLLHIGTHGFYFSDRDAARYKYFRRLNSVEIPVEELAMLRSGLLLAGSQAPFCNGAQLPEGVDDGILTAGEIALVDLQGLDLTVLSACESALGDIGADGVFGLQRGFKKAGAGAILMSLWKVDDEATSFLMSEFYRNWLDGMTKHDALEKAKRSVRADSRWDNPRYWAAFILLDALD